MEDFFISLFVAFVGAGGGLIAGLLLGLVGVAFLAQQVSTLRHQLITHARKLEARVEALEAAAPAPSQPAADAPTEPALPDAPSAAADEQEAIPVAATPPPPPWTLPSPEKVVVWVAASIGAVMLLVGALFALVAVAQTGWFGPAVRISGALVLGTSVWVLGAVLRGRSDVVGSALSGLGMGTLFATVFAARSYYELLGPTVALLLLVAIAATATLRATVYSDRFMAHLGLLGALLAPVMVSTGENNPVGLFSYLFLVLVGNLAAASWRRWFDLVFVSAAGAGLLYVGWTASWYEPQSAPAALVGAVALALPFAAVLAVSRAQESSASRLAMTASASVGATLFALAAVPWVLPIDPLFYDPRTGMRAMNIQDDLFLWATAAVPLLALPALIAARVRRSAALTALAAVAGLPALLGWFTGWSATAEALTPGLLLGALAPLTLAVLVFAGERKSGEALALHAPLLAVLLSAAGYLDVSGPAYAGALLAWIGLSALGGLTSSTGLLSVASLWSVAGALALASVRVDDIGAAYLAGPMVAALALLGLPALFAPLKADRLPWVARVGAIPAALFAFPVLYRCWESAFGTAVIGLLPVLLGLWGLVATVALVRVHGIGPRHPSLAAAIGVALLGVTFALPIQWENTALTVGWSLEAVALAWLATRLRQPLLRWTAVALGLAVGVRLLLNPWALAYGDASGWPIGNWTLYTWGLPTLCLLAAAYGVERSRPEQGMDWLAPAPTLLRVTAMFTGFALVNVEVSQFFQDSGPIELGGSTTLQGMVRSIAWGGWGMSLLLLGLALNSRYTRFFGFSFVLLAAVKVMVFDILTLPGFIRIGSLVGLGLLLIVAAVLFEHLVVRETKLPSDEKDDDHVAVP